MRGSLLLVHGTGDDAFFPFAPLIRDLVPRGVSIYLFDLDGHGASSTTLFDERTAPSGVHDAWNLLPSRLPRHVLGFSLGAALALHAAKTQAIDPASLILLAPALDLNPRAVQLLPEIQGLTSKNFWAARDGNTWKERLPAFGPLGRKKFPVRLRCGGDQSTNYVTRARQAIAQCNLLSLRGLKTPTLVIYGGKDQIVPPLPRETWRAMAPKSRTRVVHDAPHFLLPYHQETLAQVSAWLGDECQLF